MLSDDLVFDGLCIRVFLFTWSLDGRLRCKCIGMLSNVKHS